MNAPRPVVPRSNLGVWLLVLGACVVVGYPLAGFDLTAIAIGIPAGVAAMWFLIHRPVATVCAMIVIEVTNVVGVLGGRFSLLAHLSLVLGIVAAYLAYRDPAKRAGLNRGTLICCGLLAVYVFTQLLSAMGSQHSDVSWVQLRNVLSDCLFLVVVLVLIQMSGDPWAAARALVIPLAILAALCVINEVFFGGSQSFGGFAEVTQDAAGLIETQRYGGPAGDANFWGRNLILGLPLSGALIVRARRFGNHGAVTMWLLAMCCLLGGVYLTQSRGTIIATAVAFVVWVVASGRAAQRRGLKGLPVVALVLLVPGIGNRLLEVIADVSSSSTTRVIDPSVVGRKAAQQMSWAMFQERPMFGFGPATFKPEIPNFGGIVPTAVLNFQTGPDGPHNLYAQLAGETGIVGMIGWAVFAGGVIWIIGSRTLAMPETNVDRSLAAGTFAAVVGWSIASIFLHLAFFSELAIVIAIAVALAFSDEPFTGERPVRRDHSAAHAASLALGLVLGVVTASTVLATTRVPTVTVSQPVAPHPTAEMADSLPYALSVRNRKVFLPTYAVVMTGEPLQGVEAISDSIRGVVTFSASDSTSVGARALLSQTLANATVRLAEFDPNGPYSFSPVGEMHETTSTEWSTTSILSAILLGLAVAGTTALGTHRGAIRKPGSRNVKDAQPELAQY